MLVVARRAVHMAVYLDFEVHNVCPLWYCCPRVLHALKTLPLERVLVVSRVRALQLYIASIERTKWSQVPLIQSSQF